MQHPTTVVITGSASGIGQGLARAFAARGCNVMLSDLAGEPLAAAAASLAAGSTAAQVACQPCDVRRLDQLRDLWAGQWRASGAWTSGSTTPAWVRR